MGQQCSLLHYFGLLSIRPDAPGEPELVVPNQTAHHLLHTFLREAHAAPVDAER